MGDIVDSTAYCVRRGVKAVSAIDRKRLMSSTGELTSTSLKRKQEETVSEIDHAEKYVYIVSTQENFFLAAADARGSDLEPVDRVRTHTLMKTYGWPIKFFKDIPELLNTIRDAITGMLFYPLRGCYLCTQAE